MIGVDRRKEILIRSGGNYEFLNEMPIEEDRYRALKGIEEET
jgi:hypothetical protein